MLYTETVEPDTLGLLKKLSSEKTLENFVLVGGTALALQIGHRKSIDLDFFCSQKFDSQMLLSHLGNEFQISAMLVDENTLIADINGIKVDFIRFRYPFKNAFLFEDGIKMLTLYDIAPMKLDAITGRGHKKDFFDLYFLFNSFSLDAMLEMYQGMFGHHTIFHVLKSLTYFEDAEMNPDPIVIDKTVTWENVKETIVEKVIAYGSRL